MKEIDQQRLSQLQTLRDDLTKACRKHGFQKLGAAARLGSSAVNRIDVHSHIRSCIGSGVLANSTCYLPGSKQSRQVRKEIMELCRDQECMAQLTYLRNFEKEKSNKSEKTGKQFTNFELGKCYEAIIYSELRSNFSKIPGMHCASSVGAKNKKPQEKPPAHPCALLVVDWLDQMRLLPVRLEYPVGTDTMKVKSGKSDALRNLSGRIDLLCVDETGEFSILDIKTRTSSHSCGVTMSDMIQLYLYALLFQIMNPDATVSGLGVISVTPSAGSLCVYSLPFIRQLMEKKIFKQATSSNILCGAESYESVTQPALIRLSKSVQIWSILEEQVVVVSPSPPTPPPKKKKDEQQEQEQENKNEQNNDDDEKEEKEEDIENKKFKIDIIEKGKKEKKEEEKEGGDEIRYKERKEEEEEEEKVKEENTQKSLSFETTKTEWLETFCITAK